MIGLVQEVSPVNEIEPGKSDGEDDPGVEVRHAGLQDFQQLGIIESLAEVRILPGPLTTLLHRE